MKQVARAVAALVVGFAIGAMALQVSARTADPLKAAVPPHPRARDAE